MKAEGIKIGLVHLWCVYTTHSFFFVNTAISVACCTDYGQELDNKLTVEK